MFKIARDLKLLDDFKIDVIYQDGNIIRFDMTNLFEELPQFKQLKNNGLYLNGHIDRGGYGIVWNEELDIDATYVYHHGKKVGYVSPSINDVFGSLIRNAMQEKNVSQVELARLSKIDQADIYRLINGQGNPTLAKSDKVIKALGKELEIKIK